MSDSRYPLEAFQPAPLRHEVHIIYPLRRRYWLHLLLFAATIFTTLVVGARLQYNFHAGAAQFQSQTDMFPFPWVLAQPSRLLLGLPFSLTLLGILLAHEMGHFVYARRNGVYATLPFFVPAPTLIGTLGAFIRIRSPIPSRAALFDIGISGPIAGFVVAVPVMLLALLQAHPVLSGSGSGVELGYPVIFDLGWKLLHPHAALGWSLLRPTAHVPLEQMNVSPVAMAAWVGMFATSLNLLPGGQLDGGHIIYALAPRAHKNISRLTVLALLPMGLFWWTGWLVWAVLLLLSLMRHPPVPRYPELDPKRKLLGVFAGLMFLLTIIPAPFGSSGLLEVIRDVRNPSVTAKLLKGSLQPRRLALIFRT